MLNIYPVVERNWYTFKDGMTEESVNIYIKELHEIESILKNGWNFKSYLFYSHELFEQIEKQVKIELLYCEFYLSWLKRSKEEPDFNKWVLKQSTEHSYKEDKDITYDIWTLTNGKVQAQIKIDRSNSMAKMHLSYRNDSHSDLEFYSYYNNKEYEVMAHAKTEDSVTTKIGELKKHAEQTLAKLQFPTHCFDKKQFDFLTGLLHVLIIPKEGKQL